MTPCTHFVGFRRDEYHSAVKTFGEPDFIHRFFDPRAKDEFMEGDRVILNRKTSLQSIRSTIVSSFNIKGLGRPRPPANPLIYKDLLRCDIYTT